MPLSGAVAEAVEACCPQLLDLRLQHSVGLGHGASYMDWAVHTASGPRAALSVVGRGIVLPRCINVQY